MARLAFLFLSAMFYLAIAGVKDDLLAMVKSRTEAIYCGSTLADVLSLVCNGKYRAPDNYNYVLGRRKRDSDDEELQTLEDSNSYFPFFSKSIMQNFMATHGNHRRVPRGVHNECCARACSYEVLRSYCADVD